MSTAQIELIDEKKMNKIHYIFASVSAFLIILFVFFVTYIQEAKQANTLDNLNYKHLDYSDRLLIQMLNIETGARGYLLTKNEEFLNPFYDGIDKLEKILTSIERVWPDYIEANKISGLEKTIDKVVDSLKLMIQTKDNNQSNKLKIYEKSLAQMDGLRERIVDIRGVIQNSIKQNQLENISFLNSMKWAILLLSIIAFSLLFILFSQIQRRQKLVTKHALQIANENKNLEKSVKERTEELINLASYMTTSNENEKQRIARELHDELGALLTAARMDSAWINRSLKPGDDDPLKSRILRLIDTIDKGIQVKRDITQSLVPPLLRELGLLAAITAMTEDVPDENPPKYDLQLSTTLPEIDADRELALYRICQESLNNIRKYAKASNVIIKLKFDHDKIQLDVIDDGVGFSKDQLQKGTHGVTGMRARAAMFNGTLNVKSNRGKGSHVSARIPLALS